AIGCGIAHPVQTPGDGQITADAYLKVGDVPPEVTALVREASRAHLADRIDTAVLLGRLVLVGDDVVGDRLHRRVEIFAFRRLEPALEQLTQLLLGIGLPTGVLAKVTVEGLEAAAPPFLVLVT